MLLCLSLYYIIVYRTGGVFDALSENQNLFSVSSELGNLLTAKNSVKRQDCFVTASKSDIGCLNQKQRVINPAFIKKINKETTE